MTSKTERYLPLYEGRLGHQFNHRFAVQPFGDMREVTRPELLDPMFVVEPENFLIEELFEERSTRRVTNCKTALLGHRRVARNTDDRTVIACIFPWQPASYGWILSMGPTAEELTILCANYNSYVFDYVMRNFLGQPSIPQGTMYQRPVIPPHTYTPALVDFITPRVLELTYTAWDLQPFARDLCYQDAPFVWNDERRFLMRCELDALYFHLYGITNRGDVDYIMETFPIVKRKDEAAHGEYRSKRVILEMYDQMAALPTVRVPAPKLEHGEIEVPDLSQWVTPLEPPPADPRAAHVVE